ncbi:MAG TPA: sulfatase-like hydrolase/transferase [Flavobacteriales bacterium]|nr:sulfatase-like hydrolase/transferase [Flavobacteriales bacterium]
MKQKILNIYRHFLVKTFLYWMALFFVMRLLFVIMNYKFLQGGFGHKMLLFFAAVRLDSAMAAFLVAPAFLLWMFYIGFKRKFLLVVARYVTIVLTVPVVFICLMNIGNYANWQTPINKRVLLYFENISEVSHFMSTAQLILSPILIIALCWLAIFFHKKFVKKEHAPAKTYGVLGLNFLAIAPLFLFMRGGLQTTPINENAAYYSAYEPNCHAAVNPVYYFVHSVSEYFYVSDKYVFFSEKAAGKLFDEIMVESVSDTIQLTTIKHPNLVFIILESWTADVIEELGGEKGITPFTSELIQESLLFTQCYGSGYRTDQGLVSILAGYPSQPDNSIIAYPSKIANLPSFCFQLKKQNYGSSFFYGGDITFAEMKSFVIQQGFEYISDKSNYDAKDFNSKWGAHDGKVLDSQAKYLSGQKQPFISCVLTLSTHEPFEVPIKHKFEHETEPGKFKNSAYYTDQCLKNYFATVKKTDWYKNTLFVLVADHGHHLPMNRNLNAPESKRITCIVTGGALTQEMRGQQWNSVMNQHDLVKMLAPYYKVDPKKYPFAKDPFKASYPFAYFSNENILGIVTNQGAAGYEIHTGAVTGSREDMKKAKAYLQVIYADFVRQ